MAGIDYYLCDICGRKTFYDADLSYDQNRCNPATGHEWPDNVGDMIVLCADCAKNHRITIGRRKCES